MARILIIAPDSMGDQILRRQLYTSIIKADHTLAIIHRKSAKEILEIIAPTAHLIEPTFDAYHVAEEAMTEQFNTLCAEINTWKPELIISPLKNPTWLECRIFEHNKSLRKIGIETITTKASNKELLNRRSRIKIAAQDIAITNEDESDSTAAQAILTKLNITIDEQDAKKLIINEENLPDVSEILTKLNLKTGEFAFGNPAGFTNIAIKSWPKQSMIESINYLRQNHQIQTLLAGIKQESEYIHSIANESTSPVWIGENNSLKTCMALMSHAKFYLGTDTGTMHLAAAMGLPIIAIYGGGLWPRFLPQSSKYAILTQKLPCFGCDWNCPFEKPPCITSVTQSSINLAIDQIANNKDQNKHYIDTGATLTPLESRLFSEHITIIKKLQNEHSEALKNANSTQSKLITCEAKLHTTEQDLNLIRQNLKTCEHDRTAKLDFIHTTQRQLAETEHTLAEYKAQLQSATLEVIRLTHELNSAELNLSKQTHRAQEELTQLENKIEKIKTENKALIDTNETIKSENTTLKSAIAARPRIITYLEKIITTSK